MNSNWNFWDLFSKLKKKTKEKVDDTKKQIRFVNYIYKNRDALYNYFERDENHRTLMSEAIGVLNDTEKRIRLNHNMSLKEYDEKHFNNLFPFAGTMERSKMMEVSQEYEYKQNEAKKNEQ